MPSPTRKVSRKSAYKNNWRTRHNKQKGPSRNVSPLNPLHPSHKSKSKKPKGKFWNSNSNSDEHPDH